MATPTPQILKLIALVRVSGETQKNKKTDKTQWTPIRRVARDLGAAIVGSVDVAITVSNLAYTPGWKSTILPILNDPSVHIVTYAVDRIARPQDWGRDLVAIEALRAAKKRIYLGNGQVFDLATDEGYDAVDNAMKAAGTERRNIKQRTRDGKQRCAREGRWVQRPDKLPTGISFVRDDDDDEFHTWGYTDATARVTLAFDLLLQGLSYRAISQRIGLTPQGTRQILSAPIYRGMYVSTYHDTPEGVRVYGGEGQPPQLIPDGTWEAAQAIIRARSGKRAPARSVSGDNVYSAYMASAHAPFVPDLKTSSDHTVYVYSGKDGPIAACRCLHGEVCGLKSWTPAARLNGLIDAYLVQVTSEDWFVAHLIDQVGSDAPKRDIAAERAELVSRRAELDRGVSRLADAIAEGVLPLDVAREKSDAIRKKQEAIDREIADLDSIPNAPTRGDLQAMARALSFDAQWSPKQKRAWLDKFSVRVRISNDGIEGCTVRMPPTVREDETLEIGSDGLVRVTPVTVTVPTFLSLGGFSWVDIAGGYDPTDHHTWIENEQGLYRIARAAELLGVDSNRLYYLIRKGSIEKPSTKIGKVAYWSTEEIETTRKVLDL